MCVCPFVRYQPFSGLDHKNFMNFGTKMQNDNTQNVSEPNLRKKINFWSPDDPEMSWKNQFFGDFFEVSSSLFFFFLSIDAHYYCHQCVEKRFLKKVWNMPEIIFQFLFVIYTFYHSQDQLVVESQPSGIWKGW